MLTVDCCWVETHGAWLGMAPRQFHGVGSPVGPGLVLKGFGDGCIEAKFLPGDTGHQHSGNNWKT